MFMRKILSFITATTLAFGLFAHTPKNTTVKAESNDFDCTYSVSSNGTSTNLGYYGAKEVISYTEEEAIKAGIPSGFSGDVLEVIGLNSSETNKGVVLDFSHLNIPSWTIESITFRVYVSSDTNTTDGYPEIRIPKPYEPYSWSLRYYDIKNNIAKWHDVVLTQDNFYENGTMADLSTDGYLDKFELGLRHSNVADFYIDSIKVKQVEDTVAPVINYEGRDNEIISQGQTLNFKVSAIDALQGEVDV